MIREDLVGIGTPDTSLKTSEGILCIAAFSPPRAVQYS